MKWLMEWVRGDSSESDTITPEKALTSAAFFYGVRKISNNFGMLPCNLMRKRTDSILVQDSHPAHKLLKDTPNAYQAPSIWKQQHLNHAILWGDGRSYIHTVNGKPSELIPLMPDRTYTAMMDGEKWHITKPDRDDRFDLLTDFRTNPEQTVVLKDADVLHTMGFTLDGYSGISLVKMAASTIGIDTAGDKHSLSQVKKSYSGGLVLEAPPGELRDEAKAKEFLEQWRETHDGDSNTGKTALLRNGVKATVLSMSNSDAQMMQNRTFTRQQIALWLGLESILGDDNSVAYKSLEQKVLSYLMNCLGPWITQFEEQCKMKLLTDRERNGGYYFKMQDGALLRSDKAAAAEFASKLITATIINRNEARALFDLNPVEDGDEFGNPMTTPGTDPNSDPADTPAPKKPKADPTENSIADLIRIEMKRVCAIAGKSDFLNKIESFYAKWEVTFADKLEKLDIDRDKSRIHCEESQRQLLSTWGNSDLETRVSATETLTNRWLNRTKLLLS